MTDDDYGQLFRDAYALLHGGLDDEPDDTSERRAGEGLEEYLARSRAEAVGAMRKRLLAASAPAGLEKAHRLLGDLLENAALGDEALARQVAAYQCGNFHESVTHSERLHEIITETTRLDRELIAELRSLSPELAGELGIGGLEEG